MKYESQKWNKGGRGQNEKIYIIDLMGEVGSKKK